MISLNLKEKNVLILGLGISGVSTVKTLNRLGANIVLSDLKKEEELKDFLSEISNYPVKLYLGTNCLPLDNIDLIVKSPGIPLEIPIINEAKAKNIEVITDIELAYRLIPENKFIAITGTNGKTTTTTLTGEIINKAGYNCHVTGNIGIGILWEAINSDKEDIFVIETSSFQLDSTINFKPKVSVIINITPDHLNWHKTYDNYINAKKKVFRNQDNEDFAILNYDDEILRNAEDEIISNIIWFSVNNELNKGVYIKDEYIVINDGEKLIEILPFKDVKIPGKHNLENALASIAIAWSLGIDTSIMADVLRTFEGVEHRIEYVTSINDVKFFNDSKGTNSDASIKAIEALEGPIILIAGGMDKGTSFDDFIKSFNGKVKQLILLGETANKIKETANKYGFNNIYIVDSMKEAVEKSYKVSEVGDEVLLSPACASWDMYKSFEERGRVFKEAVYSLKED